MRIRLLPVVVVVALALVVLWMAHQRRHPAPLPGPAPTATQTATAELPTPGPVFTPSPEAPAERRSTVILPWESEPTPSPTTPEGEPTIRAGPSPTPPTPECVAVSYSAGVVPGTLGGVLVDIRAENRCGRDLGPLDVWFWVGGYRQGDLVQSVRAHPFDPIPRDGQGKATIVLPGSIDWYDRIEVRLIVPGAA